MQGKVATRVLAESDYDRWSRFVSSSPEGGIYNLPEYLGILAQATGGRFRVLAAERGGEIVAGVALYEEDCRWGTFVAPRLLLHYNGIVLRPEATRYPSERTSRALESLSALGEAVTSLGYAHVMLRSRSALRDVRPLLAQGWSASAAYTYVVPLADLAGQWKKVEQNLRRLVERCARQQLSLTDDDDFDGFYRMHDEAHRRKGAPLYLPERQFRAYFQQLKARGLCKLFHARLPDGRSISAQLTLLGPHPVAHTVAAAQDSEHRSLGATPFLRWRVFEELQKLGFAANDLTDASLNPVTHFKAQLGGDLELNLVVESSGTRRWRAGVALRRARAALTSMRQDGAAG